MLVLVNYCIRGVDSTGVSMSRMMSAVRLHEEWRHAVSKIKKAFSMKIVIEDRKRSNIAIEFKRKKTVCKMRGADEANGL